MHFTSVDAANQYLFRQRARVGELMAEKINVLKLTSAQVAEVLAPLWDVAFSTAQTIISEFRHGYAPRTQGHLSRERVLERALRHHRVISPEPFTYTGEERARVKDVFRYLREYKITGSR